MNILYFRFTQIEELKHLIQVIKSHISFVTGKYKEKTIQERISKNFVGHYNDIEYKLSEPELENANFSIHNDINTILMEVEENPAISESDQQQVSQTSNIWVYIVLFALITWYK